MNKKITIEITENQLDVIRQACDVYSRVLCGQVECLATDKNIFQRYMDNKCCRKATDEALKILKNIVFPELYPNASYGIMQNEAPDDARTACDIHRACEKYFAEQDLENNQHNVYLHKFSADTKNDFPNIKIV